MIENSSSSTLNPIMGQPIEQVDKPLNLVMKNSQIPITQEIDSTYTYTLNTDEVELVESEISSGLKRRKSKKNAKTPKPLSERTQTFSGFKRENPELFDQFYQTKGRSPITIQTGNGGEIIVCIGIYSDIRGHGF